MQLNNNIATKIAQYLLQINAIKLQPDNPFTWASGWKSPIYSDNRLSLSYPEIRNFVKEQLAELIKQHFGQAESIFGVATAGIPQGALVADLLNLPFGYVRSDAKKHGMGNQIEGLVTRGQKVVVIEDLISTGKSSLLAVDALRNAGVEVLGLASIFTYGFDEARLAFENAKCNFKYLCDYSAMIEVASHLGIVREDQIGVLADWRKNPSQWSNS